MSSFIDYSCSTSIERLARDVESQLKTWHIHQHGDRHASKQNSKILRQAELVWEVSTRGVQCDLELVLRLVDGPEPKSTEYSDVPYSIRRRKLRGTLDLAGIFGIGQYLLLCPKDPDCLQATSQPLNPNLQSLVDFLHKFQNPQQILTEWLQTALNYAISSANCQIPAFGIWGDIISCTQYTGRLAADPVVAVLEFQTLNHAIDWTQLGTLLNQRTDEDYCGLYHAALTYVWAKQHRFQRSLLWNALAPNTHHNWRPTGSALANDDWERYQQSCEKLAYRLVERFLGASDEEPVWGPPDDPIERLTLECRFYNEHDEPLLALPLASIDNVPNTEAAVLTVPRSSVLSIQYDTNVAYSALAATQRCVLAALIRTATLPRDTLLSRLVTSDTWPDGNRIAAVLAKKANVDSTTKALVAAMDWSERDMIDESTAEELVRSLLRESGEFPSYGAKPRVSSLAWTPVRHAAPPGRLVSALCLVLARVRSPASMALVWLELCRALRKSWEAREPLPNMRYVPGLDPPPAPGTKDAAHVHSFEPDPDDSYCLIGQKLQVFNIGVETLQKIVRQQAEKRARIEQVSPKSSRSLLNGSFANGFTTVQNADTSQEFFDAEGTENKRMGARCPVAGATLISSGDQLYAPYLLRPQPLTDDLRVERRLILAQQANGNATTTIDQRLEVAQRFQRPKLLSDMQSFKAANPGATFLDFVGWYGNPTDPLAEFASESWDDADDEVMHEITTGDTAKETTVRKVDKAAEAIRILECTRNFWTKAWDEADPVSAADQNPLFDAESTVEMALDYLENLHPAMLMCQVVAVNLSVSYFALAASAGDCINVLPVKIALSRLRDRIETAIDLLTENATRNTEAPVMSEKESTTDMIISVDSIAAASKACEALAAAEVITARAASLLSKLPTHYKLVEEILKLSENDELHLPNDSARTAFLESVLRQQRDLLSTDGTKVIPSCRQYILRNAEDSTPHQVFAKYDDDGVQLLGKNSRQTMVGIMSTIRDL